MDWGLMLSTLTAAFVPVLPQFLGIVAFLVLLTCPVPGRGPRFLQRRDPWRRFKYQARRTVMARAGNRCEGAAFLAWGRCGDEATEADHVYPWSRGGPTIVSNGQALCSGHNRSKAAMRPAWWYLLSLERRRRTYFPPDADVKVSASMSAADLQARDRTNQRRTSPQE